MELTVLGGSGAWPVAGQGCSGYLVEHGGFRLLLDPGYGVLPELLRHTHPHAVDAVYVTHGHPDHCADLNPLLRARALTDPPAPPLPVHAPVGALDAVLGLDRPGLLEPALDLREFAPGDTLRPGPLLASTFDLPHSLPNAGVRLEAPGGESCAFTGDTGPSEQLTALARGVDLLLCEATHLREVPPEDAGELLTACHAGGLARRSGVGRLLLTHLWPGTDAREAVRLARESYRGPVDVAVPGMRVRAG
ncbi:MBL fold metallo-hydrolase [Streptomyces xiaopingdaonensis]|uniref:MBL fold metallo-hydrolase n=1 Tax=Streptomyces xiaopingdaonensis TaxID=1565415 RepID=UPI0002D399E7|nr:MBL fold metallo-hydrolase [Streptomyces xiaopingdaonensis]